MPSAASRKAGFYYAHPRNRFWQVLASSFEQSIPGSVADKTILILKNGIALWDVLESCEISGSDDSSICNPVFNDISAFITGRPIRKILCNGNTAYKFCRKIKLDLPAFYLPSTSPANAAWSLERLIEDWKAELF